MNGIRIGDRIARVDNTVDGINNFFLAAFRSATH